MNLPSSALVLDSQMDENVVIYDRAQIIRSTVLENSVIGEDCRVESSALLGRNYINRRNMLSHVTLGKYSYMGYNNIVRKVSIGRFCSLAWNISIGGMNHEIDHGSTYTTMWWDRILLEQRFGITGRDEHCEDSGGALVMMCGLEPERPFFME